MRIYLRLQSDSELICYEAMALVFALASFGHTAQICIEQGALAVLADPKSRLHGMAQAVELYDLPPVWVDDQSAFDALSPSLQAVRLAPPERDAAAYDSVLVF